MRLAPTASIAVMVAICAASAVASEAMATVNAAAIAGPTVTDAVAESTAPPF